MNTRKYPRSMNEAFHQTAEYASAIERARRSGSIVTVSSVVAFIAMIIIVAIWG